MKHTNKKLWALLVAVIALVALCAFAASAEVVGGDCGDNVTWSYDTESKELTISGTGAVTDSPWQDYRDEIQTLVIESGITEIGTDVFYDCSSLENVNFPEGLKKIGDGAFRYCTSLETVSLPDGIETIGVCAFGCCVSLRHVVIPASVTSAVAMFAGEYQFPVGLKTVDLSEGLTLIDEGMFCGTKLEDVIIPNSVESIGAISFGCEELKTVHIGTELREIGYAALNSDFWTMITNGQMVCSGPETIYTCMTEEVWNQNVTIRDTITAQEAVLLGGADPDSFPTMDWIPNDAEIIYDSHIPNEESTACILCGKELAAPVITSGYCGAEDGGENLTWEYDPETKTLTISGEGRMADYENDSQPWKAFSGDIQRVVIENGVTGIGQFAFYKCTEIEEIEIPNSIESVGFYSFGDCDSLESITFPASVTDAPFPFSFGSLSNVKTITLEEGLKSIDLGMLSFTQIEEITIPNSVEQIGSISFLCPNLTSVRLGANIKKIGFGVFDLDVIGYGNHEFTIYTCMNQDEFNAVEKNVWTQEDEAFMGSPPSEQWVCIPNTATIVYNAHIPGEPVEETVAPVGTTDGHIDSVTYCTLCGREASREVIEVIPAHTHTLAANWTWSDDGTMATAIVSCTGCDFSTTILCTNLTREPQTDGRILCTATVTYDNVKYTDTKIVQSGEATPVLVPQPTPVKLSGRCSMCRLNDEYKDVPVVGWIISIIHFFVHLASRI